MADTVATPRTINTPRRTGRRTHSFNNVNDSAAPIGELKRTIVLDNGTGVIKCGFAGDDAPLARTVSVVGRKKAAASVYESTGKLLDETHKHLYVGNEALDSKHDLILEHPVEHGVVQNWDHMEVLWDYAFAEQLDVDPQEHYILLTEPPLNPLSHREKMAEIIFEAFCAPGLFVGMQALLALYSEGLTTGLVLDIGDGVTHCVPVFQGYGISHAVMRQDLAGRDLSAYMGILLRERGYVFNTSAQRELVREVKEHLAYCALDFAAETEAYNKNPASFDKSYTLPDGQEITLGDQRFRAAEPLFQPNLLGRELLPLPDLLLASWQKCPIDTRKPILQSVLVSGGTTMVPNFTERLKHSFVDKVAASGSRGVDIKVLAPQDRQNCVWRGGSVLAALSTFETMVVKWEEYEEVGPAIMQQKNMELRNM